MNYTPGYTSNYNNGYRTFTTYGKNYSDTIMMLGRDYEWSDVVPEDHPRHNQAKANIMVQEAIKGREFTLQEAREWALKAYPDLMDWTPGQDEPEEETRPYSIEEIIPVDHPAYQSVVDHITWKESMIGRFMTRDEVENYAQGMVESMRESDTTIYTDQPSPEAVAAYEQGGIDFGKVLPYAAAGALALFLLNR